MIRRGPIKVGIVAAAVIAATCFSVRPAQADFGISIGGRRGGVSIYSGGYQTYPTYRYRSYPSYGYRSYYSSPVVPQIYYGRPNYYSRPSYYGSPVYRHYTPYRQDYRGHHHHHHHSGHHHHGHHDGHR